jgi:hypothetical protein
MTALGKKDEDVSGGLWPTFPLLCAALGPRPTSLAYRRSRRKQPGRDSRIAREPHIVRPPPAGPDRSDTRRRQPRSARYRRPGSVRRRLNRIVPPHAISRPRSAAGAARSFCVASRFPDGPAPPSLGEGRNHCRSRLHRRHVQHHRLPSTSSPSSRWAAATPLRTEITETACRHCPLPFGRTCAGTAAGTDSGGGRGSGIQGSGLPRDSGTSGVARAGATREAVFSDVCPLIAISKPHNYA